jgi:DNA primase
VRIPEKTVQEILARAKIEDIIGDYVQLVPKGDRLWGLSPFKTEKTPSFTVRPDKGVYYCFSTQKGGNVVNFLMEKDNLSFPEALTYLAKKLGIDINSSDGEYSDEFKNKNALEELYRKLTQTFHHFLLKTEAGKKGLDYLLGKRGLPMSIVEEFQLGYVPADPFWLHLGGNPKIGACSLVGSFFQSPI